VREAKKKYQVVSTLAMNSSQALAQLIQQKQEYDFIYIDGDHSPAGVLTDAVMAWGLLRKGGVMLFDDYEYDREPTKIGIDAFLRFFWWAVRNCVAELPTSGDEEMILTLLNMFALFVATFAVLIFAVVFSFFLFIMFACVYIGWMEIKSMPIPEIWNRITK
jgi:hypothetical protein